MHLWECTVRERCVPHKFRCLVFGNWTHTCTYTRKKNASYFYHAGPAVDLLHVDSSVAAAISQTGIDARTCVASGVVVNKVAREHHTDERNARAVSD